MTIAVLGGLDRLKKFYEKQGKSRGMDIRVYSQRVPNLTSRLTHVEGIVVFTGTIAHPFLKEASVAAKRYGIPVIHSHSNGLSGLKKCLSQFKSKGAVQ